MNKNPNRRLWIGLVAVHVLLSAFVGSPSGASTAATSFAVAGLVGSAVVVAGVVVQKWRYVAGSWMVVVGLIPTLLSITGPLVLVSGLWTANLALSLRATELDHEAIRARRSGLFKQSWVWLTGSGVLFAAGFLGLARHNTTLAQLLWGPAAFAALIGIWLLATRTDTPRDNSLRSSLQTHWWLIAAGLIAATFSIIGISDLLNTDERDVGAAVMLFALAALIATGLATRSSNRKMGSRMIGVGTLPGASAMILFWFPPALLAGLVSLSVTITAFSDSTRGTEPIPVPAEPTERV